MRIKQPFKAVPIKPDREYIKKRNNRERRPAPRTVHSMPIVPGDPPTQQRNLLPKRQRSGSVANLVAGAAIIGALGGIGSVLVEEGSLSKLADFAGEAGIGRKRAPQPGDYWRWCNDARAVGTAPIYSGEPGYRPEMDGDGDGIACEPYRGY